MISGIVRRLESMGETEIQIGGDFERTPLWRVWEEVEQRTSENTELSISFVAFMVLAMQIGAALDVTDPEPLPRDHPLAGEHRDLDRAVVLADGAVPPVVVAALVAVATATAVISVAAQM